MSEKEGNKLVLEPKKETKQFDNTGEIIQKVPYALYIENKTPYKLAFVYHCDDQDKYNPYFSITVEEEKEK